VSRRGFVLVTVLWLLAAGSAIVGLLLVSSRTDAGFARNRILLDRASWAREACLAILLAKKSIGEAVPDTVDLGRGVWCTARVEEQSARLDVNRAAPGMLRVVLGSDALADALLDWLDADDEPRPAGAEAEWYRARGRRLPRNRPITSLDELHAVRGFERFDRERLARLLTVDGDGTIDLNAAPEEVLRTVPGLDDEAVLAILRRRGEGRPIGSAEELLALLSRPGKDGVLADYGTFLQTARFEPSRFILEVAGGIRATVLVSRGRVTAQPGTNGFTVLSQVVE
jgi:type II secretory pathway component PulK